MNRYDPIVLVFFARVRALCVPRGTSHRVLFHPLVGLRSQTGLLSGHWMGLQSSVNPTDRWINGQLQTSTARNGCGTSTVPTTYYVKDLKLAP